MTQGSGTHLVQDKKQLAALISAVRQEIVDALCQMGTVPASELAATLGRPADALYYHLHVLKKAGLVIHAGYRGEGVRREELIQVASPDLKLLYQPGKGGNSQPITAIVRSMLRLGIRDFGQAIQSEGITVSGPGRELWALRRTGKLRAEELPAVNRAIESLARSVANPNGKGRLYGITILLTPLDHRARKPKQKPVSHKRRNQ